MRPRRYALTLFSLCLVLFTQGRAGAMPIPVQLRPGQISAPMQSGVLIGGQAGEDFSLLAIRSEALKNEAGERLTLVYGDRYGNTNRGEPGFFQVALDRDARRVVIDLAQVRKTTVDPQKLARILALSKLVTSSDITMDPYDGSTNITLHLSEPVTLKVVAENAAQSQVMIDLRPSVAAKGMKP